MNSTGNLRALSILVVLALLAAAPGCDQYAADKESIRDVFMQYGMCRQNKNGVHAASLVTKESLDYFGRLVKVGLDGKKQEIAKMCAADRSEIVMMRHLATRAQLKKLDGKGYVIFAYGQGWYVDDGVDQFELGPITVGSSGQRATAQVTFEGKRVGHFVVFVKEGEAWKLDEASIFPFFNDTWAQAAAESGMTEDEVILDTVSDQSGKPVPPTIWDPMK